MQIAIVTCEGFNEIDSFVASYILGRVKHPDWHVYITCPDETVTSLNGVRVSAQRPLEFANDADVVLFGSVMSTPSLVKDERFMARLRLDPSRQLLGSQCSGALFLAALGLLRDQPACTTILARSALEAVGVQVLDQPFFAAHNVATAGGCLASQYLASWVIWRCLDRDTVAATLQYVAPVGEQQQYIERALAVVAPYIAPSPVRGVA